MSPKYNTIKKDVPHIFLNRFCPSLPESHVLSDYDGGFYPQLLSSLGFDSENPPMAALLEGDYIISPVSWEATHNNAFIVGQGDSLQWSLEESRAWFDALAVFLDELNFTLQFVDASTWVLKVPKGLPALKARPVYQMNHVPLISILAGLDSTHYWQRILTEIQMYFSTHALQNTRLGKLPVNGVWIWGGAMLSTLSQKAVFADAHFLPLAKKLTTHAHPYQPENIYKGSVTLLLDETAPTPIIRQASSWFWKDISYYLPPSRWWLRFWRKYYHAH